MSLPRDPWLAFVLALSLGLFACGLTWGLPSVHGWAPDEIIPARVLEGMAQRFSNGWFEKYPPLHYYLLAVLFAPLTWIGAPYAVLFCVARSLSVLMATGTVYVVYLCGREVADERAARLSASIAALSTPFVYYAKLANTDVPYVFWFALSLVFYLRALKSPARADLLGFAVTAALAISTKDQAYALYPLPAVSLAFLSLRSRARAARDLTVAAVAAAVLCAAIYNLPFNADGFLQHLRLITGPASQGYQAFPSTLAGHFGLLRQTVAELAFSMGTPLFGICVWGALVSLWWRDRLLLLASLFGLSYYVFFLSVVLYSYDRFVLPLVLLLALHGGKWLAGFIAPGARVQVWRLALVGGVLLHAALRAVSVDLLMVRDSRYGVEDWLRANVPANAWIGTCGPLEYLPRLDDRRKKEIGPSERRLARALPDYLILNADAAARARDPREQEFYRMLETGVLGYRLRLGLRSDVAWLPFDPRQASPGVDTNLDKINPEIRVYGR